MRTIEQWLSGIKDEKIRKSALLQADELDLDKEVWSFYNAISSFQIWDETDEGMDFWRDICNNEEIYFDESLIEDSVNIDSIADMGLVDFLNYIQEVAPTVEERQRELDKEKEGYYIMAKGGNIPKVRHSSLQSALGEAKRIADKDKKDVIVIGEHVVVEPTFTIKLGEAEPYELSKKEAISIYDSLRNQLGR